MTNINNNYKRIQSYQNNTINQKSFKQNYMEQNYKVGNKLSEEKRELGEKRELPKQDNTFLKNASRLGVNNQGQFFKK